MSQPLYDDAFFERHRDSSRISARAVVPLILDFLPAKSVVDVGCGIGTWLAEFRAAGVADHLGVDGDYVDRTKLLIEPDRFLPRDLAQPLQLGRPFDLAVCLEVAEHLPPACAATLIESLTRLAPAVVFSAAIPGQRGKGHINEQWANYWCEIFGRFGYVTVDCLRAALWDRRDISVWYRQNSFFFVDGRRIAEFPKLAAASHESSKLPLDLVHPELFVQVHNVLQNEVVAAQRSWLRAALQLREINLIAFPDWKQSIEHVERAIVNLKQALATHPDRAKTALIVHWPQAHASWGSNLLRRLNSDGYATHLSNGAQSPRLLGLTPEFGSKNWELLVGCAPLRVQLPQEDLKAIEAMGARQLRTLTLEAIQAGKSLVS